MNIHLVPNWSEPVRETYEFRTSIFTTEDGSEQRRSLRMKARRGVSFLTSLWLEKLQEINAILHNRGAEAISIADPARYAAELSLGASAGEDTIVIKETPPWLTPGISLCLYDLDQSEFVEGVTVQNVGAFSADFDEDSFNVNRKAQITLDANLVNSWPAGTIVRPVITGHLESKISIRMRNDSVAESNVTIGVLPPSNQVQLGDVTSSVFDGRPVLLTAPNWTQAPTIDHVSDLETVDYGRGITKTFINIDFETRINQFNYTGRSRTTVAEILNLFHAMRGRQGEFYCPTYTTDLVPVSGISAASSQIIVRGLPASAFNDSVVNRAIAIKLVDGRWLFRKVVSIVPTVSAGTGAFNQDYGADYDIGASIAALRSAITIDSPLGEDIARKSIAMICWLNLCRFASDSLTVVWSTDDLAQIALQIMTLEALAAE